MKREDAGLVIDSGAVDRHSRARINRIRAGHAGPRVQTDTGGASLLRGLPIAHLENLVAQAAHVQVVADVLDELEDELLLVERAQLVPVAPARLGVVADERVRVLAERRADERERAVHVAHERPQQAAALELVRRHLAHGRRGAGARFRRPPVRPVPLPARARRAPAARRRELRVDGAARRRRRRGAARQRVRHQPRVHHLPGRFPVEIQKYNKYTGVSASQRQTQRSTGLRRMSRQNYERVTPYYASLSSRRQMRSSTLLFGSTDEGDEWDASRGGPTERQQVARLLMLNAGAEASAD